MGNALSKPQIISQLSENLAISKKQTSDFLVELASLAYKEAANSFSIPGIGKLELVERKARKGRNPATGQEIDIPAKKAIKFKISKACKDAIIKED